MAKLSFIVAVIVAACWALQVQGDDELEAAWKNYRTQHHLKAASAKELVKLKSIFASTHAKIVAHNNSPDKTYTMGHNEFSILTKEEKRNSLYGYKHLNFTGRSVSLAGMERSIAPSVDLRNHKCMPQAKTQNPCGSCWAFAATTVVEFGHCLLTNSLVLLSEQQLVDCDPVSYGCNGGSPCMAWEYLASSAGHVTAASYPYTAVRGTCAASKGIIGAKVAANVQSIARFDIKTILTLLSNNQLVFVCVAVFDSFDNYSSGVYREPKCDAPTNDYHAMVAVGYGTLNGIDFWILRNSWGSRWGQNGYMLFQRGVNMCGIENGAGTIAVIA